MGISSCKIGKLRMGVTKYFLSKNLIKNNYQRAPSQAFYFLSIDPMISILGINLPVSHYHAMLLKK
jgi:hypothetical protein